MSGSRCAQQTTLTTLRNTQVRPEGGWPGDPPWDARGTHSDGVLGLHVSAEMKLRLQVWLQLG